MVWDAERHGSPFAWSQGESFDELTRPERVAQIKEDHEKRRERLRAKRPSDPLRAEPEEVDLDEMFGTAKSCFACHM